MSERQPGEALSMAHAGARALADVRLQCSGPDATLMLWSGQRGLRLERVGCVLLLSLGTLAAQAEAGQRGGVEQGNGQRKAVGRRRLDHRVRVSRHENERYGGDDPAPLAWSALCGGQPAGASGLRLDAGSVSRAATMRALWAGCHAGPIGGASGRSDGRVTPA